MKKVSAIMILFMGFLFFASPTDASGSQLIIINKKTNTLAFYDGGTLVKKFRVATGRQASFTPEGTFKIVNKIKNRPYYTKNIPGGDPRNPLGDRWMGLEARGTYGTTYGIHGNSNEGSVGGYVSAGCVRMHNQEIRWLFDQVQVYTKVVITRSDNSFDAIAQASGYMVAVPTSAGSTNGIITVQNGWVQTGSKKYYYENGAAKKGWQTISGKRYFFDGNGVMKTGWLSTDGKKYYFDNQGVLKTGWLDEGGNRYYLDPAGMMKTGWLEDGGNKYFLDPAGVMKTGWLADGDKRYYFDTTGEMKTDWVKDGGKWYYFDHKGVMNTGWINVKGKWYYIHTSGYIDATVFTLNSPDYNAGNKLSWLDASMERYFQNSIGELVKSWVKYGDNWYYLFVNKEMAESSRMDG